MGAKNDFVFELNNALIRQLIKLAKFNRRDRFYDMGSGTGKVIAYIARHTDVKRAIGIEHDETAFRKSWRRVIRDLTNNQMWFMDLRLADIDSVSYSDATVVFYSLDEDARTIDKFAKYFGRRHFDIITKNLPLVGYVSEARRGNDKCWFFKMKYPLKRLKSKKAWAISVIGKPNATIDDVYGNYVRQIKLQYPGDPDYAACNLRALKRLVKRRF
jgi:SAM-dependent methyltransferase